jgi:hypothetical protein
MMLSTYVGTLLSVIKIGVTVQLIPREQKDIVHLGTVSRVARWHIFKPNIPIGQIIEGIAIGRYC